MKHIVKSGLLLFGAGVAATASAGYFEFSSYGGSGSEYDVASYGNTVYWGGPTSIYSIDVAVADLSKKEEPRFLADGVTLNPNYQTRIFTNPQSISLTGSPLSLQGLSTGEMYVNATTLFRPANNNSIMAFDKVTGAYDASQTHFYASGLPGTGWGIGATFLSYGGGKWWSANESRNTYSSTDGSNWVYEFTWNATPGGSHGDGLEYVNGFLFVSDMTSNYIEQWGQGDNPATPGVETGWNEWTRFDYAEIFGSAKDVEGMGFGALGHFWAGSGSVIYELGGGTIQGQIDPTIPEPATLLLLAGGLLGMGASRKFMKKT
ncbi:MAG: PEP-CTERM sorting domain-containing protein [Gammaproteobacteria bacterium]|nr:PEP-CTERM sorting domain-containing protein [Gammaproteobacteria bacterium]MBU1978241.1 PEP-CTERM sorting domain-containing protein [Gammaproteobacteria bacterium]